jgi:hypothetical protein
LGLEEYCPKYRMGGSECYYNKTFKKAEKDYCVTRRELLAIVRTPEHFRKYIYEQDFHLHTDHSALNWLMGFKNLERQTARWIQHLQV